MISIHVWYEFIETEENNWIHALNESILKTNS